MSMCVGMKIYGCLKTVLYIPSINVQLALMFRLQDSNFEPLHNPLYIFVFMNVMYCVRVLS